VVRVCLAVAVVAACAARQVTPVSMSQAGDDDLTCTQLNDQMTANQKSAADLLRQDRGVEVGNTVKIATGTVLAPIGILIALTADLSNEEQVKARALIDRDERLTYLAHAKGCNS
jgi:hypothetical protein